MAVCLLWLYKRHRNRQSVLDFIDILTRSRHWVVLIDKNDKITFMSDNMDTVLGVDRSVLIGKTWNVELPLLTGVRIEEIERNEVDGTYIQKYQHKDGTFKWIEWKGVPHPKHNLIVIGRDITLQKESEIVMRQSTQLKRTLLDNIPGYVVCKDYEGRFLFANKAIAKLMGKSPKEVVGLTDRDYGASEEDILRYQTSDRQVIDTGVPLFIPQQTILRKDGSLGIFQTSKFPISFGKGKKPAVLVIDIDITNLKRTEAELLNFQNQLLYKSNILTAIGKITEKLLTAEDVQTAMAESLVLIGEATGVDRVYYFEKNTHNDLISQKVEWTRDCVNPQMDNPQLQDMDYQFFPHFQDKLHTNKYFIVEVAALEEGVFKDLLMSQQIISMLNIPVFVHGVFYGFIGFDNCTQERQWTQDELSILQSLANNIANALERSINQQKIIESERNFRQINETIDDVFWLYDIEKHKIDYISPSCQKVLGVPQEWFYGKHDAWLDYTLPEDVPLILRAHEGIERDGYYEVEYRIRLRGEIRWIFEKSFAITDSQGKAIKNSGISIDITEQKLTDEKLKRLSLVAEKTTNGVLIVDAQSKVLWANQAFLDMMEIQLPDLLHQRPGILFGLDKEAADDLPIIVNSTRTVEALTFKKKHKWLEISNTAIYDEKGEIEQQIEIIADITQRTEHERIIQENEDNFRQINDTIETVFWLFDVRQNRYLYMNPSCERVLGVPPSHFYEQKPYTDIYVMPAYRQQNKEILKNLDTEDATEWQYQIMHPHFGLKWVQEKLFAIRDEQGRLIRVSGICNDVTESVLKQQELARLLDITNKQNERLTNFAHIISHNIRSHSSNLSSLMDCINEARSQAEVDKYMALMQKSIDKLAETIQNLNEIITIQNNTNIETSEMNLRREIETTINALGSQIQQTHAEIVNEVPANITIKAIPAYLESILLNFLSNALKYRSPERTPHVSFSVRRQYKYWRLAISDNGLGIDLEKHGHKLFGMYKTFHKNPDARGIGLFITKSQIEAMGGKIEVESKVGTGTTFYIYFYAED